MTTTEILGDRQDIEDLVQHLTACLDEGRFDDMRSLFTADATVRTPGGTAEGAEALVAQAARNHPPDKATQHLIGGMQFAFAEQTAAVRANALVTIAARDDGRPELVMGEVYRFYARRTDEGWRLTSVETVPTWRIQAVAAAG